MKGERNVNNYEKRLHYIKRIENISSRDHELDMMRAFSIFWVIMIHCLYWPGIVEQGILLSLFLIEMPLIFLITGASNIYAKKRTLLNFYYRRLMRVLKPYEVYAVLVIIIHLILKPSAVNLDFIINWIIPKGGQIAEFNFLNWHLWFMPVYILVVLVMPLLIFLHEKGYIKYFYGAALAFMVFIGIKEDFLTNPKAAFYIPTVIFYAFWTTVGFEFVNLKIKRKDNDVTFTVFVIWLGLGIIFLLYGLGLDTNWNMQMQKTPVRLMFVGYSFISMSLFYIFSPAIILAMKLMKNVRWMQFLIDSYNKNGFTIYLFHPFIFLIMFSLFGDQLYAMNKILSTVIIFIVVTVLSPIMGHILGKYNIR